MLLKRLEKGWSFKQAFCTPRTNIRDLTGKRFGRFKVIKKIKISKNFRVFYLCKCKCGNFRKITHGNLISRSSRSCGCLRKELREKRKSNFAKLPKGEAAFNALYSRYKRSAQIRNLSFNLSKKDFRKLTKSNCFYCNNKPHQLLQKDRGNGGYLYNGIDRKDNTKGYSPKNSVSCCGKCNLMKFRFNIKEFFKQIKKIYEHKWR